MPRLRGAFSLALIFAGVFLTGMYTGRLFFGVFHGPRRYHGPLHQPPGVMLWPLAPLAVGAVILGYLEWPVPILSTVLGDTVGHAEPVRPSVMGLVAGALGLAGFFLMAWRTGPQPAVVPALFFQVLRYPPHNPTHPNPDPYIHTNGHAAPL